MKLIKINNDHYVIVDDSEIKEGDYLYSFSNNKVVVANKLTDLYVHSKKITHSTQPLESMNHGNYYSNVYLDIEKLSLQEAKELIGEVDVEKKAEDFAKGGEVIPFYTRLGFKFGYNQAIEDNKEKLYTEDDMKYIFECGRNYQNNAEITFKMSMEHLQISKTEWEVEFVYGKLKIKEVK